ncbi:IclR family transcriptional regulator [Nitratireductor sp. ZSWI3]|uniref:IclR family transcriptional regulator n=1 Tax=Nitratireductor sp. ZSWI3 TaxID=2966359 RepID=UPI00214F855E|nr:helix-turn-helix domain-containing protein [Nitratireductor sp. ZSWI3]MCR4265394.1 helix-turn-helix domain-containing protein [Nitratireductor sp. ZSWI3]
MSGRGAERILLLVEWLAGRRAPVTFSDVVAALDLPKSSALGLLRTLVDLGYVRRESDGRYRLLRLPGEPTDDSGAWGTLARLTEGVLREAVREAGESGFIAVLDEQTRVRYISKILPDREIRYDRDITVARKAYQVTSGLVLLTGFGAAELRSYAEAAAGEAGVPDLAASIIEKVEAARAEGHAVNLRGVVEGAAGIAAPVFDADGRLRAALNIAGPADRMAGNVDRVTAITCESAERATAALTAFRHRIPAREARGG